MESHPNRPLITLGLIAYKQDRFIREAVASALAQTYSPLQIVLSDDASPDSTFEIMREGALSLRRKGPLLTRSTIGNPGVTLMYERTWTLATRPAHGAFIKHCPTCAF